MTKPSRTSLQRTRPARIVLLDDEAPVREAMRALFDCYFQDYGIVECADGNEALREIHQQPPDLRITDFGHAGPRPEEMLRQLSKGEARLPVVVSSAHLRDQPDLLPPLLGGSRVRGGVSA